MRIRIKIMAYTILLNKIRIGGKAPKAIHKGGTEVKCVYKGSTLVYDTQKSVTNTNRLTISYPSNYLPCTAGSTTPSITKGYDSVAVGHSGATYNKGFTSVSNAVTFSYSSFACSEVWGNGDASMPYERTWGSLNTSTGKVDYIFNRWPYDRSVVITAKCTINGTSTTTSQTLYQLHAPRLGLYIYTSDFGGSGGNYNKGFLFSNTPYAYHGNEQFLYSGNSYSYGSIAWFGIGQYPTAYIQDAYGSWVGEPITVNTQIYIYYYTQQYYYSEPTIMQRYSFYIQKPDSADTNIYLYQ